jgi:hypothetical protein
MYTVIIPTMWRGPHLEKMLPIIDSLPLIGEIILINNASEWTPPWFRNRTWSKVEELDLGENIMVNPAWELGISRSNNDLICLMSDDIIFDIKVFDFLKDKMSPDLGCVGPDSTAIHGVYIDTNISIQPCPKIGYGYGTLLFLHKSNYKRIPKEFKIFYGDTWIYNTHIMSNKMPRKLVNFFIQTKLETTSGAREFSDQTKIEHRAWGRMFGNT